MSNDLVTPADLAGFPGAPFADEVVDAAVASLRATAGWHIAPSRTETLTVDGDGGTQVLIPTLMLTAVSAIRNVYNADTPTEMTGFRFSNVGIVHVGLGAPWGFRVLEVDVVHGYAECPADLKPAIVAMIQALTTDATVAQQAAGPFSVAATNLSTLATWLDRASASAVARYTLPSRP